jgi:hypothetical protein
MKNTGIKYVLVSFLICIFFTQCEKIRWNLVKAPQVSTDAISNIGNSTAISGGTILKDGGSPITARGVCWGTAHNPLVSSGMKTSDGEGAGSYQSTISGLATNEIYYIRAYATNSIGTSYGNEITIKLSPRLPTISTEAATNIFMNSASIGGNVSDDGGDLVITRGICWSTSDSPTIGLSTITSNGGGIGIFKSYVASLSPGVKYYARAYATNSVGTSYGNQISFTTPTTLIIGQPFEGGIIFYLDGSGNHGLVCSDSNVSYSSSLWGCPTTLVGTSASVGSGAQNTANIVAQSCAGTYSAARLCYDAITNGYSDWFLPSIGELVLMYNNLSLIGLGNFQNGIYWSSSEWSASNAYYLNFNNGTQFPYSKVGYCAIRPIRAF